MSTCSRPSSRRCHIGARQVLRCPFCTVGSRYFSRISTLEGSRRTKSRRRRTLSNTPLSTVHSLLAFRSLKSLKSNLRQCLPLSLRRCFVSVYTNHESVSDHESFFDYIIGLLQTCQCMYRIQINLLNHESLFWRILEFESKFVTRSIRTLTSCCSLSLSLFILCCRAVWPVPGCCFYCRDFRRERRLVARKCFQDIDQRVCNFLNPSRVEYVFKSLFCLDYASVGK